MATEIQNLKVGDELAFSVGYGYAKWHIHKITGITKTGSIKCGDYVLNPDLSIRGKSGYSRVYRGQIITDKIRAEYKRQTILSYISRTDFSKLSQEDLEEINEILIRKN